MLRRFTLLALVGSCTAFGVAMALRDEEPADVSVVDIRRLDYALIARRARELDARLQAYRTFDRARSAIVGDLARGKTSLIDACQRLRAIAKFEYPWYLDDARRDALGVKHWLAHALLRHIELEIDEPYVTAVCRRLESEIAQTGFQSWCRDH